MKRLVILGAGGYARTICDVATQTGKYEEILYLDDNKQSPEIAGKCADFEKFISEDTEMYPAIGDNGARMKLINLLKEKNANIATFVHSTAYVSPTAVIKNGVVVLPNAVVNTGCVICDGVIINCGAIVDHDCTIEEGVHLCPGAVVKPLNVVAAGTKLESNAVIYTNVSPDTNKR